MKNPDSHVGSEHKEFAHNAGDPGSIPGLGRSPEEGNGNPLKYSCLENSMDRGAWWAIVHGVTKSQTWLNKSHSHTHTHTHTHTGQVLPKREKKFWSSYYYYI